MRLARAAEGIRFIGPLMKVISFVSKCDFNYFYFEVWPTRFRSASASPDPLRPAGCVSVFGSSSERQMYSPSCWSCPCFLWIFLGGPNIEKLRGNEALTQPYPRSSGGVVGVVLRDRRAARHRTRNCGRLSKRIGGKIRRGERRAHSQRKRTRGCDRDRPT
jgi:hypothetical protein